MVNLPHQNRLSAYDKPTAPKPALYLLQNQLCAVPKPAAPKPALCLLLNRLCIGTKPAFSFWINISNVSEVRFDCQGLGLVARNEASILVFDTKPVFYRPVLDQIQFCSFDRGCKTCLDTKPVLDQGRFCSLTYVYVTWGYWTTIQKIKHYLRHENKVNENKVLSYCEALSYMWNNGQKVVLQYVKLTNPLSF